jgi:hypothetical protein
MMNRMFGRSAAAALAKKQLNPTKDTKAARITGDERVRSAMADFIGQERTDLNETQRRTLGQNNPPGETDQSTAQGREHHPQSIARAMPWIVLGVWLLADLAVVLYWASQDWGFLGDLLLIIGFAGNVLGLISWLTAWLVLSDRSLWQRAAYFCVGIGTVLAMISVQIKWWDSDVMVLAALAQHMVAIGTVVLLVRRRGYRIKIASGETLSAEPAERLWWQFSIGEMFLMTTAVGLYVGLSLFSQTDALRDMATILLVCSGLLVTLLAAFGCRSFWWAVGVSSAIGLLVGLVAALISPYGMSNWLDALLDPETWIVVAAYGGTGNLCAIVAVGLLRPWGYRLTRV